MLSVIFIKLSAVIYCSCAKLHCADQNECHMRVHMALLLVSNAPPPPSPPPPPDSYSYECGYKPLFRLTRNSKSSLPYTCY